MFKRNKNSAAKLAEDLDKLNGSNRTYEDDPNEWKPTKDNAGNANAVLRILPAKGEGDEVVPFARMFVHKFKNNGRWYWQNCPTTIKQDCPACAANKELWDSGIEANKDIAKERKRKLEYWANVYVIQDKLNPEAVGKVFKMQFGAQIMEKIEQKAKGDKDVGIDPIDVTDPWEGCNLVFRFVKTQNGGDYKQSEFLAQSELLDGDEDKLEEIFNSLHPLTPIIAEDKFKNYDELEKKLNGVIGKSTRRLTSVEEDLNNDVDNLSQVDSDIDDELPWDEDEKTDKADSAAVDVDDEDLDSFFDSLDE